MHARASSGAKAWQPMASPSVNFYRKCLIQTDHIALMNSTVRVGILPFSVAVQFMVGTVRKQRMLFSSFSRCVTEFRVMHGGNGKKAAEAREFAVSLWSHAITLRCYWSHARWGSSPLFIEVTPIGRECKYVEQDESGTPSVGTSRIHPRRRI
jgi:hypothetical protein